MKTTKLTKSPLTIRIRMFAYVVSTLKKHNQKKHEHF